MESTAAATKIGGFTSGLFWSIFIVALVVFVAVTVGVIVGTKGKNKSPVIPPTKGVNVKLEDEVRKFYSISSTEGLVGRDVNGSFIDHGEMLEEGIISKADALKYPLTYAAGAQYYTDKAILNRQILPGYTWDKFVLETSEAVTCTTNNELNFPDKVVVVEDNNVFYLDVDANVKGIVVRRGGILFIKSHRINSELNIQTNFILVESGGLLQAGGRQARYTSKLNIEIVKGTSLGYGKEGVVASQYSFNWYFPGTTRDLNQFSDFNGTNHHVKNTFGVRCVGVGFNGNLNLFGDVSAEKLYQGTWSSRRTSDKSVYTGPSEMLSIGVPSLHTHYPTTYGKIEEGSGAASSTSIFVDLRGDELKTWTPGSEIVLTCTSRIYARTNNHPHTLGTPAIWLNYPQGDLNRAENERIINSLQPDDNVAIEVAKIKEVVKSTGEIRLEEPLRYNRSPSGPSSWYTMQRTKTTIASIDIDTRMFVGLLTRNIKITGKLYNDTRSGGMNNIPCPDDPTDPQNLYKGPGGHVTCDYTSRKSKQRNHSVIYEHCFKDRDDERKLYLDPSTNEYKHAWRACVDLSGNPVKDVSTKYGTPKGMWQLGTHGFTGAHSIGGGQTVIRYGSSSTIDGVEFMTMGYPGNVGSIGVYAIHYHICGRIRSFTKYLPDTNYRRDATVSNCVVRQSPSRAFVLHGSSEVNLSNNITFLTYGSAFFEEVGDETDNIFQHNLTVGNFLLRPNRYDNPSPLLPFTSFGFYNTSTYWIKNSQCIVARNVITGLPRPMLGIWSIVQNISTYKGISSFPGDIDRELPGNSGREMCKGLHNYGTSSLTSFSPGYCYSPEEWKNDMFTENIDGCKLYAESNVHNPVSVISDNVMFNVAGVYTSYISFYTNFPNSKDGQPPEFSGEPVFHKSVQARYTPEPNQASYLPMHGSNSCTEEIATEIYVEPTFTASNGSVRNSKFQPYTTSQVSNFDGSGNCCRTGACPGNTMSLTTCSIATPFIISSNLSFNTATFCGNNLNLWIKASQVLALNCCFLQLGSMVGSGNSNYVSGFDTNKRTSGGFRTSYGDNQWIYCGSRTIYHNLISDAALMMSDTAMILTGEKTFFANTPGDENKTATIISGEYPNDPHSIFDVYLTKGCNLDNFEPTMFSKRDNMNGSATPNVIHLYVDENATQWRHFTQTAQDQPVDVGLVNKTPSLKLPYMCQLNSDNATGALATMNSSWPSWSEQNNQDVLSKHHTWATIVNSYMDDFFVPNASLGNEICDSIVQTKPCP